MVKSFSPRERIVLAIDTSDSIMTEKLVQLASKNGAKFVKFGLEYSTATSWKQCAQLAQKYSVGWIADAKFDDIPNTTARAIKNILRCKPKPYGITVHGKSGLEAMRLAQKVAGQCIIFGVTELTAIPDFETKKRYGVSRQKLVTTLTTEIATSGAKGIVASGKELQFITSNANTKNLITLIPGIRSKESDANDQHNTVTPTEAIENGANLIVIGREITQANNPQKAFERIVKEIESQISLRSQ